MESIHLVVIEPARPADLNPILELLRDHGLPPDGLDGHLGTTLVARRGEELVGCAAVELYGNAALLRSVAVRPALRGLGLGAQLVHSCLDMARQHGVDRIYLLTETAADYFPRFGFVPIERSQVDKSVRQSVEFTSACPDDAQAMVLVYPQRSEPRYHPDPRR